MKSRFIVLALGIFISGTAQAQTKPGSKPVGPRPAVRPPATTPNRQQELYDQYHGVSKKPAAVSPANRQPAPLPEPETTVATTTERPVSAMRGSSGVRIGVRGGITYPAQLEKLVDINTNPAVGFVGGFVANFGQGRLSFQPELNYARYAYKLDDGFGGLVVTTASNQLEVPLLLKIASGSVNSNRFFMTVGPYAAYTLGISIGGQNVPLNGSGGRFSFGAAAGLGAALKAGPGHLTIEVRGLYPLGQASDGIKISTDSRTINAQATLGYMFPLGGR